jgi:hypothetical protein
MRLAMLKVCINLFFRVLPIVIAKSDLTSTLHPALPPGSGARFTPPTHSTTQHHHTLLDRASACISLVTTELLPAEIEIAHISIEQRVLIEPAPTLTRLARYHVNKDCPHPGAKLAIHHHWPFSRRIARR